MNWKDKEFSEPSQLSQNCSFPQKQKNTISIMEANGKRQYGSNLGLCKGEEKSR